MFPLLFCLSSFPLFLFPLSLKRLSSLFFSTSSFDLSRGLLLWGGLLSALPSPGVAVALSGEWDFALRGLFPIPLGASSGGSPEEVHLSPHAQLLVFLRKSQPIFALSQFEVPALGRRVRRSQLQTLLSLRQRVGQKAGRSPSAKLSNVVHRINISRGVSNPQEAGRCFP